MSEIEELNAARKVLLEWLCVDWRLERIDYRTVLIANADDISRCLALTRDVLRRA